MRHRLLAIATVLGLTLLACTAELGRPVAADSASSAQRRRIGYDAAGRPASVALEAAVVTGSAAELPPIPPADVTAAMVIRTANASIQVDSLEPAVARVRQLAARVGGFVANTGVQSGTGQLRSASLEIKVPAVRFDEALSGLSPIGKLESVNVEAEDVGEEYVDVTARMENAHRLEQRLIDLLATRTGKLKDVLDVEQSLARVREEIERYEGRLRYLRAHTAMSTLTVYVHEPVPVVGSAGTSVMGEAFKQSWRNFVALLALVVQSLGIVIPLGAIAAVSWLGVRRWRGSRPAGAATA
ncbi:MAG TPA: DUF4349 domain-containing protein [Gemmatimonadales bacterium]|nr:DUF4349 domain-containing protein [Gemmatimonadales bacterium]